MCVQILPNYPQSRVAKENETNRRLVLPGVSGAFDHVLHVMFVMSACCDVCDVHVLLLCVDCCTVCTVIVLPLYCPCTVSLNTVCCC